MLIISKLELRTGRGSKKRNEVRKQKGVCGLSASCFQSKHFQFLIITTQNFLNHKQLFKIELNEVTYLLPWQHVYGPATSCHSVKLLTRVKSCSRVIKRGNRSCDHQRRAIESVRRTQRQTVYLVMDHLLMVLLLLCSSGRTLL